MELLTNVPWMSGMVVWVPHATPAWPWLPCYWRWFTWAKLCVCQVPCLPVLNESGNWYGKPSFSNGMKLMRRLHVCSVCNTDLYILCFMYYGMYAIVCMCVLTFVYMYRCRSYIWMLKRTDLYICVSYVGSVTLHVIWIISTFYLLDKWQWVQCKVCTYLNALGEEEPKSFFEVQLTTCLYFNCWPVREYQDTVSVELCCSLLPMRTFLSIMDPIEHPMFLNAIFSGWKRWSLIF